jgi:hypothetical protein
MTSTSALTAKAVQRHLPKSIATAMGHLNQLRKNMHSAQTHKRPINKEVTEFDQDTNPTSDTTTNQIFAGLVDLYTDDTEGKLYSDLTGRFPAKSQNRNLYVLVLYTYNNNTILVEALKNRTDSEQLAASAWGQQRWK